MMGRTCKCTGWLTEHSQPGYGVNRFFLFSFLHVCFTRPSLGVLSFLREIFPLFSDILVLLLVVVYAASSFRSKSSSIRNWMDDAMGNYENSVCVCVCVYACVVTRCSFVAG